MAKRYQQRDSGLIVPDWMPERRLRRQIGSPKEFMFTPSGACGCYCDTCTYLDTCTIFADDFTADDLSSNWTQQSGSWSISSDTLSTSSSNALLICSSSCIATAVGTAFYSHAIKVSLKAVTGSYARIIFSYSSTAGTYNYVEIYWNGTGSYVYIKTSSGTVIATSSVQSFTNGSWYSFQVCVESGRAYVSLNGAGTALACGAIASSLVSVGVGTGTTSSSMEYDDFGLYWSGDDVVGCPQCYGCDCSSYCTAGTQATKYQVTLSGIIDSPDGGCTGYPPGTCTALNGTFVLYQTTIDPCTYSFCEKISCCTTLTTLNDWCRLRIEMQLAPYNISVLFKVCLASSSCGISEYVNCLTDATTGCAAYTYIVWLKAMSWPQSCSFSNLDIPLYYNNCGPTNPTCGICCGPSATCSLSTS